MSEVISKQSSRVNVSFVVIVLATLVFYAIGGIWYITGPLSPYPLLTTHLAGDSFLRSYPTWGDRQEFDDAAYNRAAVEALTTGIPRDHTGTLFLYAPIYAYFLAACYGLGGFRLIAFALPQAALAALTCALVMAIVRRISTVNKIAASLIAGMLLMINVRLAMYVGFASPTLLLMTFFCGALLAATNLSSGLNLVLFVILLLLASWTQAGFFFVTFAAGLWLFVLYLRKRTYRLLLAGVITLLFSLSKPVLPGLLGQNQRGSTNATGEGVLWEANNPCYEDMTLWSLWERRPANRWSNWVLTPEIEHRYDQYLERAKHNTVHAAVLWIEDHPAQYATLATVRFRTTIGPYTGMMSPRNRVIALVLWLLTFPAGIYGLWRYRREDFAVLGWIISVAVILCGALVITDWYLRYRLPMEFFVLLYAPLVYSTILQRSLIRKRRHAFHPPSDVPGR